MEVGVLLTRRSCIVYEKGILHDSCSRWRLATKAVTASRNQTTSSAVPVPRTAVGRGAVPAAISLQSRRVVSKSSNAAVMSARISIGHTADGGNRAGRFFTRINCLRSPARTSCTPGLRDGRVSGILRTWGAAGRLVRAALANLILPACLRFVMARRRKLRDQADTIPEDFHDLRPGYDARQKPSGAG